VRNWHCRWRRTWEGRLVDLTSPYSLCAVVHPLAVTLAGDLKMCRPCLISGEHPLDMLLLVQLERRLHFMDTPFGATTSTSAPSELRLSLGNSRTFNSLEEESLSSLWRRDKELQRSVGFWLFLRRLGVDPTVSHHVGMDREWTERHATWGVPVSVVCPCMAHPIHWCLDWT
jgi:hypothetical protein